MANRVLSRRGLKPPYDLDKLANEYGELEYMPLLDGIDGITVGIGELAKPQILIDSNAVPSRMKFTLAHEIGHVVIPWHTGTIVSHVDQNDSDDLYWQMESEANAFAAELLMPSDWLAEEFNNNPTVESYFSSVLNKSGASKEAAFYKIFKSLDAPVICVQIDYMSRILKLAKSHTAPYLPDGARLAKANLFDFDTQFETFQIGPNYYAAWKFAGLAIEEQDQRAWREILQVILDDAGMNDKLPSVNATLAAAYNKTKSLGRDDICAAIFRAFAKKDDLDEVTAHELFEQYVIKRVIELSSREKKK